MRSNAHTFVRAPARGRCEGGAAIAEASTIARQLGELTLGRGSGGDGRWDDRLVAYLVLDVVKRAVGKAHVPAAGVGDAECAQARNREAHDVMCAICGDIVECSRDVFEQRRQAGAGRATVPAVQV